MSASAKPNAHWFFTRLNPEPQVLPDTRALTDPELMHHVKTVMRLQPGALLVLVDDDHAQPYACRVETVSNKQVTVTLLERLPVSPPPRVSVTAVVGLIKGQRWDWMLQKLAELGVSAIIPLETRRTVVDVKNPEAKRERWHQILKNAAEQSERVTIPRLYPPQNVETMLTRLAEQDALLKLVASERSGQPIQEVLSGVPASLEGVVFAIGPEGGWEDSERERFQAGGFQAVSFGDKILRSETAALYFASVIDYALLKNIDSYGSV